MHQVWYHAETPWQCGVQQTAKEYAVTLTGSHASPNNEWQRHQEKQFLVNHHRLWSFIFQYKYLECILTTVQNLLRLWAAKLGSVSSTRFWFLANVHLMKKTIWHLRVWCNSLKGCLLWPAILFVYCFAYTAILCFAFIDCEVPHTINSTAVHWLSDDTATCGACNSQVAVPEQPLAIDH